MTRFAQKPILNNHAKSLLDIGKPGLVSAYDFGEGLMDLVGSNDGTQNGVVTTEQSRLGTFVRSDEQGSITLGTGFASQTDFFCSLWYTHRTPTRSLPGIVSQYIGSASSFRLVISSGDQLSVYNDIDNAGATIYSTSLIPGVTYHILFGINSSRLMKMWIDGVPLANNQSASSQFSTIGGSLELLANADPTNSSAGSIANLEIFNTDKTTSDAEEIYSRGKRVKSYFTDGLIASGNTFSSDSFVENSSIFVLDESCKIETETINGYKSKVLESEASAGSSFKGYLPISVTGVNTKQAAYGTWNMAVKRNSGDTAIIGFINKETTVGSGNLYALLFDADDSIRVGYYGISTLIDSVTAISASDYVFIRITRDHSNEISFWANGSLVGRGTDANITKSVAIVNLLIKPEAKVVLHSENPSYSLWHSPLVIEP